LSIRGVAGNFSFGFKLSMALVCATGTMALSFRENAIAKQQQHYPTKQTTSGANLGGGTIYHTNGTAAWRGLPGNSVFYQNGQVAWRGNLGNDVYYENGQLAWGGDRGDSCYYSNGSLMRQNCTSMSVSVGAGITLNVSVDQAILSAAGKTFVLAGRSN
jgi:hypothetical protein